MALLSLDTSFSKGSMALIEEQKILTNYSWEKEKSHSETITLYFEKLINEFPLDQIEAIVCGIGPGSFTGIRVALSLAKSLAYSLSCPVYTIENGLALSLQLNKKDKSVVSLIDAQKNKVFCSIYRYEDNLWKVQENPFLASPSELDSKLTENSYLVVGNGLSRLDSLFPKKLKERLEDENLYFPEASLTGLYIEKHKTHFSPLTWKQVEPLYLRKSSAEEVLESKNN